MGLSDVDLWFLISAAVTVGMQLLFFFVAYTFQFDLVTDFAGSSNFIIIAVMTMLAMGAFSARAILVTTMLTVGRLWLAFYLLYRVCKRGHDSRFNEMRSNCGAFFVFWVFQMVWVFAVSSPVIYVNAAVVPAEAPLEWRDWLGLAIFAIGLFFEVAADLAKSKFRSNPDNKGKVCDIGVWSVSRHPNYFGEVMVWWGVFTSCTPVFNQSGNGAGYATLASPLFTMLILLFLSGVPSAECGKQAAYMKTEAEKQAFLEYRRRTPVLIPCPCGGLYEQLPRWFKAWFCCEFRFYEVVEDGVDVFAYAPPGADSGYGATSVGGDGQAGVDKGDSSTDQVSPLKDEAL